MPARLSVVLALTLGLSLTGCKETCDASEQEFAVTVNSSEGELPFTHASILLNHSDADACITSVTVTLSTSQGCTFNFSTGSELDSTGAMAVDAVWLDANPECIGFPTTLDSNFSPPVSGDWDLGSIDASAVSILSGERCQEGGVTVRLPQRLEVPTFQDPPAGQTYLVEFEAQEFELPFAAESIEAMGLSDCPG